jgi:hypothetical protein
MLDVTVTVLPEGITTVSPLTGVLNKFQLVAIFQFPVITLPVITGAEKTMVGITMNNVRIKVFMVWIFRMFF